METYKPGTMIGQYEVASLPMKGGMGVVYFCLDHGNNGKPVALKTFLPKFLPDRKARDRFLREGTAWVDLGNHPHIVRCYEVEYIDPAAFLVLELIAKEQDMPDASLRSWLIPGHPLPIEQALLFALQIARGMQHAIEKIPGFVHRDLKPENILVGADRLMDTNINRLRVTDFGLAAILKGESIDAGEKEESKDVRHTQLTHGIAGTPLYMAPEQWNGVTVGAHTDVYALGCILYEMASGQRVVAGKNIGQLREAHCLGKLQPLSKSLPKDVDALIAKCLALKPDQRYRNWDEVIKAIEHAYLKQTGKSALRIPGASELDRVERIQMSSSYNAMGQAYMDMGKADVSVTYFQKSLTLARQLDNTMGQGAALGNLGIAYRHLGDVRRSINYLEQCLALSRKIGLRGEEGRSLAGLGTTYLGIGDERKAIEYYEQVLIIDRETGNRRGEGITLNNLAVAYQDLGDVERAIEYSKQALIVAQEIGDRRGEGKALHNIGRAYNVLGDSMQGVEYLEKSLAIKREIGDRRGEGNSLCLLGSMYLGLGIHQKSIELYDEARILAEEIDDQNGLGNAFWGLAVSLKKDNNIDRAIDNAEEALKIFTAIESPNAKVMQDMLAKWEAQMEGVRAPSPSQANPVESAVNAFQYSDSLQDLQSAVLKYPFMTSDEFIQSMEEIIELVPPNLESHFKERLAWLQQISHKQKPGFLSRLFGRK